ncbi:MAG TPA: ABC transporter substrate-binding protein [Sporichthyaceae bacterium]|jgi:NitT/TauT family transport system substrate-binding protein|nr:ABC transporter substrate-binding protein [Sporichthyaceae bacterium]
MTRPSLTRGRVRTGAAGLLATSLLAAGCTASSAAASTVTVDVGYQSKTINTINAGTLLRDRGTFEAKLAALGKTTGTTYSVHWLDFPSGPPLTAQMLADKVDIGSMGDYPTLVNGSKTAQYADSKSELIGITGYNLRGSLNQIVVPPDSPAHTLADLRGQVISTSIGSAAHGMIANAVGHVGMSLSDVRLLNQEPSVGASALMNHQVAALGQFVPWPQLMVFRKQGRLLYDGGTNNVATFHAVLARQSYAKAHPEVMQAFLESVKDTSDYINAQPLAAAQRVATITGIEPEVVYLYNGPNGLVTFDPTIKQPLTDAMATDLPFLKDLGSVTNLDLGQFVNDQYVRAAYGAGYDTTRASLTDPDTLHGTDTACNLPVDNPRTASEVWFAGQDVTSLAASPTCALQQIATHTGAVRAAYVPDTVTGTRLFADAAVWVLDPTAEPASRLLPFALDTDAAGYVISHPQARQMDYPSALARFAAA